MTVERKLKALFDLLRSEAKQNPDFGSRLAAVLGSDTDAVDEKGIKRGNRRAPSTVDPVFEIQKGEQNLRDLLAPLDLEQLRDVVAEYRMDPNKLVMKWHDRERIVDHIVETAMMRSKKGDAFRA
jgi:hypothetical protein